MLKFRLMFVVCATSAFVFIDNIDIAIIVFIVCLTSIILRGKVVYKRLLIMILIVNTIYIFAGNILFAQNGVINLEILNFNANSDAIIRGATGALKRNSMILLSFIWLSSLRSPEELYRTLQCTNCNSYNKYLLIFLRNIINQRSRIQFQMYSLRLRGAFIKRRSLKSKIIESSILLRSLFNRLFFDLGSLVYAGESHFLSNIPIESRKPYIEIRNLTAAYDGTKKSALNDVNLFVDNKCFIFLDGKNKSGKTTLLRVLSGYIPNIVGELQGHINICGVTFSADLEISDVASNVRYITDDADNYIVGITVQQEILLHTKDKDLGLQCLQKMNIDDLIYRETATLSGGEKVRLVLASLLASRTQIILLDSVLPQLDEEGRLDFLEALKVFYKNNTCIVIAADYYPEYFISIANRILHMEDGRILYDTYVNLTKKITPSSSTKHGFFKFNKNLTEKQILKLENVTLSRDGKIIVKNLSINICESDIYIIIGKNGSGKTTSMLAIAGLIKLDSGERHSPRIPLRVGYVFQNASLQIVGSTVEEELLIGPILLGWHELEKKSYLKKKRGQLPISLMEPTLNLHSIDLRFLCIASCDVKVDLIIFDEPSTCMDNKDLTRFISIIEKLRNRNIAVLIVTHDKRIIQATNSIISMDKYSC